MNAETTRFGTIEVKEQSIIRMPEGMMGFPQCTDFVLIEEQNEGAFKWFQSLNDPGVAFIVINPLDFIGHYEFELADDEAERLGIGDQDDAAVLTTVTINRAAGTVTTNLAGPIVMNSRTLLASQIVLSDDRYTTSHVLGYEGTSQGESLELANAA
jgi:flagellar assembly factor FliW